MKRALQSIILILLVILAFMVIYSASGQAAPYLFGVLIPYLAFITFLVGIILRILGWAKIPVPFKIPTTCGQQKSLPWLKREPLDNPHSTLEVIGRMFLEVVLFRSLFRNSSTHVDKEQNRLIFSSTKYLWLFGILFHYSFLIIFIRHFRFFTEPVPGCIEILQKLDGFAEIGVPTFFLSELLLVAAATYLLIRRLVIPQVRYISLPADYFPLLLILSVALSGVLMRHFFKVDLLSVKELFTGLISFNPGVPTGIGMIFYFHLFCVSLLMTYFPFSKLMHMGGVFLSPTRNMANDNRENRHVNPWNYPVKTHTYEEYEDEFRDLMKAAGLPLDKEK